MIISCDAWFGAKKAICRRKTTGFKRNFVSIIFQWNKNLQLLALPIKFIYVTKPLPCFLKWAKLQTWMNQAKMLHQIFRLQPSKSVKSYNIKYKWQLKNGNWITIMTWFLICLYTIYGLDYVKRKVLSNEEDKYLKWNKLKAVGI